MKHAHITCDGKGCTQRLPEGNGIYEHKWFAINVVDYGQAQQGRSGAYTELHSCSTQCFRSVLGMLAEKHTDPTPVNEPRNPLGGHY